MKREIIINNNKKLCVLKELIHWQGDCQTCDTWILIKKKLIIIMWESNPESSGKETKLSS